MGRKKVNARRMFIPAGHDLAIEFNPFHPVDMVNDVIQQIDIDPVEVLYTVLVLGTLSILFLPSLIFIVASL